MIKRLILLALLLPVPLFAQSVGCGGVPGAVAQAPKNGCGGVPGSGGGGTPGLPIRWKMNEGTGDSLLAVTPNINTITASNITWGTGIGVTSPTFNGTSSIGIAASDTLTNFDGTKPFSISTWINYFSTSNFPLIVSDVGSPNGQGWQLGLFGPTNGLFFSVTNTPSANYFEVATPGGFQLTPGVTTNIIVTYDGSQSGNGVNLYANGVVTTGNTIAFDALTASAASGLPVSVGNSNDGSGSFYSGSMGDLQIFGTALTQAQVTALYNAGPQ